MSISPTIHQPKISMYCLNFVSIGAPPHLIIPATKKNLIPLPIAETNKKIGEEQFKRYRRSWDIAPPPMAENDNNQSLFSPLNASIPIGMVPFTESLKDTYNRVVPFYEKEIKMQIQENKNILVKMVKNLSGPLLRNAIKQAINIFKE